MILIPAGPFLMGAGAAQQTVELPDFLIARYPVTNEEYLRFVRATGHRPRNPGPRKDFRQSKGAIP